MVTAVSVVGRGAFGSRTPGSPSIPVPAAVTSARAGMVMTGSSGSSGSASAPAMMAGTNRNRL